MFFLPLQAHGMTQKPSLPASIPHGHIHPQAMLSSAVNPVQSVASLSSQAPQAMHVPAHQQPAATVAPASVIQQQGGPGASAISAVVPAPTVPTSATSSVGPQQPPLSGAGGIMPPVAHHTASGLPSFNPPPSNFMWVLPPDCPILADIVRVYMVIY